MSFTAVYEGNKKQWACMLNIIINVLGFWHMNTALRPKHVSPKGFSHGHGLWLLCVHRPFSVWRILILPQETSLSLPESGKQKI
jgi:hypothetical protein